MLIILFKAKIYFEEEEESWRQIFFPPPLLFPNFWSLIAMCNRLEIIK